MKQFIKGFLKDNVEYFQALILVIITVVTLYWVFSPLIGNADEGGGKCFSHHGHFAFEHRNLSTPTVTPKAPVTSYQLNIVHMTDSIKVYDGSRYVGQCAEKDLETLILKDNQ